MWLQFLFCLTCRARYCFNALKPFLKNCLWPGPEYPMKRYHWDLDDEETARQYKLLCYRVRLVARGTSATIPASVRQLARAWKQTVGHRVRKVHTWGPLRAILQQAFQRVTGVSSTDLLFLHAAVVCSTVMAFAGHAGETLCPPGAFAEFDCKPGDIVPVTRPD